MSNFNVPTREQVSENNQAIFDNLERVGFVLTLQQWHILKMPWVAICNFGAATSLNNKQKEVVNLAVSQVNGCKYCQSAHTATGK
jgi:alkylhydroperoxidase family enzyme